MLPHIKQKKNKQKLQNHKISGVKRVKPGKNHNILSRFRKSKKKNEESDYSFAYAGKSPKSLKGKKMYTPKSRKNRRNFLFLFLDKIFDFNFQFDRRIFLTFILILIFGIIAVTSSSVIFSYRNTIDNNRFAYVLSHLIYICIGFGALSAAYFLKLEFIAKLWFIPLFISIGLLGFIAVLSFLNKIDDTNGAYRWLVFGSISIQPSDLAKLAFVIFLAAFLTTRKKKYDDFRDYFYHNLLPFALIFGLILGLIIAGKNLGTAIIVGSIGLISYSLTMTTKYHLKGLLIMIFGGIFMALFATFLTSYRQGRLEVFWTYWKTGDTAIEENGILRTDGRSYQFTQMIQSLGSAGWVGTGLGQSIAKFNLPLRTSSDDAIFTIIGEEMGFLGGASIILLYGYLTYLCFSLAGKYIKKPIYFYMMIGCASWIGVQAFVHIGGNIGIIPITGQTLPFISLGGSSLVSLMTAMGLILNVSKQPIPNNKDEKDSEIFEYFIKNK